MQWTQSIAATSAARGTLSREVVRLTRLYAAGEREKKASNEGGDGDDGDCLMGREHWYLGGYENQEVHALKELGCALRGETRRLSRPVVDGTHQRDAVDAFEEALDVLEAHWRDTGSSFDADAEGASIKLSILGHLGDIFDAYLEPDARESRARRRLPSTLRDARAGEFRPERRMSTLRCPARWSRRRRRPGQDDVRVGRVRVQAPRAPRASTRLTTRDPPVWDASPSVSALVASPRAGERARVSRHRIFFHATPPVGGRYLFFFIIFFRIEEVARRFVIRQI